MARRAVHRSDLNQAEIIEALRKCGVEVRVIEEPVDLLCGWGGDWVLLEVKEKHRPGDKCRHQGRRLSCSKATPDQEKFFSQYPKGPVFIVMTAEEAISACRNHRLPSA